MLFTFLFLIIILLFHHTRRGQGEGAQLAGEGVGWLYQEHVYQPDGIPTKDHFKLFRFYLTLLITGTRAA